MTRRRNCQEDTETYKVN